MKERPALAEGQVIYVERVRCIVRRLYDSHSIDGAGQVVYNKEKPTTRDISWNGEHWIFPQRPDFGGYSRDSDPFVQKLRA